MIETGHFAELDNILRLTLRQYQSVLYPTYLSYSSCWRGSEDQHDPLLENGPEACKGRDDLQTFVFSATLSKDLQRNLRRRAKPRKSTKNSKPLTTLGRFCPNGRYSVAEVWLEDLLERLDFRDPEPEAINLSPEGGVVSSLQESQIECLSADKVGRP
jgi:ATP-dependent RNA helicase DDX24/MAK5